MNRRQVLEAGGGVLATLLAGCTAGGGAEGTATVPEVTATSTGRTRTTSEGGTPSPPPETVAVSTSTVTGTPVESYRDAFAAFLEPKDATVEKLRVHSSKGTVELRYTTERSGYEELGAEVGMISGGFFRQVARGWEMSRLNATIIRPDGSPAATWYAKVEWFREFQREEISASELSLRILETLEPVDG